MLWAVLCICLLVFGASLLLIAYFNRRDARIRVLWQSFVDARAKFFLALGLYQVGFTSSEAFPWVVMRGKLSLDAFRVVQALRPELEPDADWMDSLRLVEQMGKRMV